SSETDNGLPLPTMASSIIDSSALGRAADDDVAAGGAGNRTPDGQQTLFGINLDHDQVLDRAAHVAHLPGHLLAGEHAARRLALADGARRAVRQRVTVRGI